MKIKGKVLLMSVMICIVLCVSIQAESDVEASIEGVWTTEGGAHVLFFLENGTYASVSIGSENKIDLYEGKWRSNNLKIFSYMYSFQNLPPSPVIVARKTKPSEEEGVRNVKEIKGLACEFIDKDKGDVSSDNVKFIYIAEKQLIRVNHGDYFNWYRRSEKK